MAAAEQMESDANVSDRSPSKIWLILSVLLCFVGGAAGYFGVSGGLVPFGASETRDRSAAPAPVERPNVAFVDIPTLVITLPPEAQNEHLRFAGQIEVPSKYKSDVEYLMPRIQDMMNGYLRALTVEDIEGPGALFKIRLHMFRRIIMVVGLGKANSLLVTEFILK